MVIKKLLCLVIILCSIPASILAQEFILRPTPGEDIILAVADIEPASNAGTSELNDAMQTFNQVLWNDLSFAGFFTMAGKSFYPSQSFGTRSVEEIPFNAWAALPFPVTFLSMGTMRLRDDVLFADLQVVDMDQRERSFGQTITGDTSQVREIAHQWADEIVYRLSAGASRGIASTKIAYTVKNGNTKEIFVMDYDGANPRAFTRNGALNLYPGWSRDNTKLSFASLRTGNWEVNVYSYIDGTRLPFPTFDTFASTPALSPDGTRIAFTMRTSDGDHDIYVANI
ncbi:MAG: hypothetical protein P8Z37_10775, partial [Acidobacteriota bacterium]